MAKERGPPACKPLQNKPRPTPDLNKPDTRKGSKRGEKKRNWGPQHKTVQGNQRPKQGHKAHKETNSKAGSKITKGNGGIESPLTRECTLLVCKW